MASLTLLPEMSAPGFSFENVKRNQYLEQSLQSGLVTGLGKKARKTGTTIVGLVYKDGVVLGADTRATEGNTIADKNCSKIHYMAPNIYCCGAGTAADTEYTTAIISANIELHRLETGKKPRVATACRLLKQYLNRYHGQIGAHLVLGGVDVNGPALYTIAQHGSTDKLPYVTMGSGSLAAMAVFESGFRPNMEREEAKELVADAIRGGIFNDLGSGSFVDLCVITSDGVDYLRPYELSNKKGVRHQSYLYPVGATPVLTTEMVQVETTVEATDNQEASTSGQQEEAMET